MAKLEHVAERDSIQDFLGEVNAQCWRYGYKTQESLGAALGISQVTAGKYLRDPRTMAFSTLRKLVKVLKPDPIILLKAVGYTSADIRKLVSNGNAGFEKEAAS